MPFNRDREVTFESLQILSTNTVRGGTVKLQLVRWNNGRPTVEKREWYQDDDGNEKCGKAKGLNLDDLEVIIAQAGSLRAQMGTGTPNRPSVADITGMPRRLVAEVQPTAVPEPAPEAQAPMPLPRPAAPVRPKATFV